MKRLIFILLISTSALLLSCAKNISIGNANEFKKGMTYTESGLEMYLINNNYTYDFSIGSDKYRTISYEYQIENSKYTYFTFIFKNDLLFYWGYPDELNKEPDEDINNLGDILCKQLIYNLNH